MTTLGERLKRARIDKGLSQPDLAELVGIKQQSINGIEKGKTKQTRHILELAEALGVRAEWLARGDEPRYPQNGGPGTVTERMIQQEARRLARDLLKGRGATPEQEERTYNDFLPVVRRNLTVKPLKAK